jgi:hypothetical protein
MNEICVEIVLICLVIITITLTVIGSTVRNFCDKFTDKNLRTNKIDRITGDLLDIRHQQERILKELCEINKRGRGGGQKCE